MTFSLEVNATPTTIPNVDVDDAFHIQNVSGRTLRIYYGSYTSAPDPATETHNAHFIPPGYDIGWKNDIAGESLYLWTRRGEGTCAITQDVR